MRLHVKVGTHSAYYAWVIRKRKPPKVGDVLWLKSENKYQPIRVRCELIKKDDDYDTLYYFSL